MNAAASTAPATARGAFSRSGALTLVAVGTLLFAALAYLIGAGESFGGERGQGQAHAASNGLNGYAGLARLTEAQGYDVTRSRSPADLRTEGLLVLSPPLNTDAEELAELIGERRYLGPTLVILPKWRAAPPPEELPLAERAKFKRGWVVLTDAIPVQWAEKLPEPYRLAHAEARLPEGRKATWAGFGVAGSLPTGTAFHAAGGPALIPRITDPSGRALAAEVTLGHEGDVDEDAYPVMFLAEPDLVNNFGLADGARAAAGIAMIDELTYDGDINEVVFDLTLNGFGTSENLLTLAFRPPFLASTLALMVALLIVGWRAFQRFGPPAADAGPDIAFGKRQLIANGAGLILRARRYALLGRPYAALSARRLGDRLGLARPVPEAIDAALARRLPDEEPFTHRAARLEAAKTPAEILAAARALDELNTKLS
jgi:hypothetical protein